MRPFSPALIPLVWGKVHPLLMSDVILTTRMKIASPVRVSHWILVWESFWNTNYWLKENPAWLFRSQYLVIDCRRRSAFSFHSRSIGVSSLPTHLPPDGTVTPHPGVLLPERRVQWENALCVREGKVRTAWSGLRNSYWRGLLRTKSLGWHFSKKNNLKRQLGSLWKKENCSGLMDAQTGMKNTCSFILNLGRVLELW